ncbi:hypothetical protein J6590_094300 [Homalodisca vitripennis]|nr:hypothetical protein J6590_094300 [Homalodisca vitripennis]
MKWIILYWFTLNKRTVTAKTGPGTVTITAALSEPARTRTASGRPAPCHGQLTGQRATTSLPTVDCHCMIDGIDPGSLRYRPRIPRPISLTLYE